MMADMFLDGFWLGNIKHMLAQVLFSSMMSI